MCTAPRDTIVALDRLACTLQHALAGLGAAYLIATSCFGLYFLQLVQPSMTNDLWWHRFTTAGPQTFLGDLFHHRLQLNQTTTLPLCAPELVLEKDYVAGAGAFIDMKPSLSRQVLLTDLPFESVLGAMRQTSFAWNIRMFTQYCWVDWNQTYELSITAKRQQRCASVDATNAAVYWEPLLRNSKAKDIAVGPYATSLQISIFDYVQNTSAGATWLNHTLTTPWLPIAAEAAVWKTNGMSRWQTEMTNYYEQGLQQTIVVETALGRHQNMTIHLIAQSYRGLALWSLFNAYEGIWNNLADCQTHKCSLIRSDNNHSVTIKNNWEVLTLGIAVGTTLPDLVDAHVGPMGSIDVKLAFKPEALEAYYIAYQQRIVGPLLSAKATPYFSLAPLLLEVAPPRWLGENLTYYGGNPMCLNKIPLPFVQGQFGFYDACNEQRQATEALSRPAILFAAVTLAATVGLGDNDVRAICGGCVSSYSRIECTGALTQVLKLLPSLAATALPTENLLPAMTKLDFVMLQFGLNGTTPSFFSQPLIAAGDPWSFFGWAMVYDWLEGTREAVRFEADYGTYSILTAYTAPTPFPANQLELPKQACTYVWVVLLYSSAVMTVVALLVLVSAFVNRLHSPGWDLIEFHRVASLLWVGRPFLLVRSFAALTVLSTSPVDFLSDGGVSRFVFAPRLILHVMVLAGEATWATYVLVDLLLPVTPNAKPVAWLSCLAAWVATTLIEATTPYHASVTVQQTCDIVQLGLIATCSGGIVRIGSPERLLVLVAVQVGSVVISLVAAQLWNSRHPVLNQHYNSDLLPASAQAFLTSSTHAHWYSQSTTTLMAGMLPLGKRLFNVNLWQFVAVDQVVSLPSVIKKPTGRWDIAQTANVGKAYVIVSVAASFIYIFVSDTAMTNDFWWADFNSRGHQTFLVNWFTTQLQLSGSIPDVDLTSLSYSDNTNAYNTSTTVSSVPLVYASMVQDEVNTLPNVIAGLRAMDGCDVPWIATYYCYADFNRTWEMAVSSYRQERCASADSGNGAVYLESYLRNVNWAELLGCWESSLEVGVFSYLRTSVQGRLWLDAVRSVRLPLPSEVAHWQQRGISAFWQNYKSLGVLESFTVQNAFGIEYPMSLKYSNGSLHSNSQTSFKMQWPLASQLWAVGSNATFVAGSSLVRQSPAFAFGNVSMTAVLAQNRTVLEPLDIGSALFTQAVGPFGSVAMRRVTYPAPLLAMRLQLMGTLNQQLATANASVFGAFKGISSSASLYAAPSTWLSTAYRGGDVTCPIQSVVSTLGIYFSNLGVCISNKKDGLSANGLMSTMALLATGPSFNISQACTHATQGSGASCVKFFTAARRFVELQYTVDEWTAAAAAASSAREVLQTTVPVSLTQFGTNTSGTFFLRSNLLAPEDPTFHVFGWLYISEWLQGVREVVSFTGASGAVTTLSGRNTIYVAPVDTLEVPVNVAYYFRCVLLYVTGVLFLVALIGCGYIISSRGQVEGFNMLSLNRVAGLVWIGRPLLLLRGITAICLLSTAKLDLAQANGFFHLVAAPQSWFTTVMATSEVTWIVYIFNDVFSVVTKQYTPIYADASGIAVWAATAVWSLVAPVHHSAQLQRECAVVSVDNQIVCHAGRVVIGDTERFEGIVALAAGLVCLTYLVQRWRFPRLKDAGLCAQLLHSTAYHHYVQDGWVWDHVYHIDRASAAFNGLLSVLWGDSDIIVLDIKTWRVMTRRLKKPDASTPKYLADTIPLV
ncbi:hypothetical protein ACHHYP_11962 [Achlya hypogyna]|uniref:Transmembrane protein n=1 Tax=Achlya hypogyna TaxID=1202772 RepID=A0A1V9ZHA0_ACHHY|nr:hypothetical protein ACHHYP_11962 [Achlya hypogyna]